MRRVRRGFRHARHNDPALGEPQARHVRVRTLWQGVQHAPQEKVPREVRPHALEHAEQMWLLQREVQGLPQEAEAFDGGARRSVAGAEVRGVRQDLRRAEAPKRSHKAGAPDRAPPPVLGVRDDLLLAGRNEDTHAEAYGRA